MSFGRVASTSEPGPKDGQQDSFPGLSNRMLAPNARLGV